MFITPRFHTCLDPSTLGESLIFPTFSNPILDWELRQGMFQQNPLSILSEQLMVESQFLLNSQPEPCWRTRNIVKGQRSTVA